MSSAVRREIIKAIRDGAVQGIKRVPRLLLASLSILPYGITYGLLVVYYDVPETWWALLWVTVLAMPAFNVAEKIVFPRPTPPERSEGDD